MPLHYSTRLRANLTNISIWHEVGVRQGYKSRDFAATYRVFYADIYADRALKASSSNSSCLCVLQNLWNMKPCQQQFRVVTCCFRVRIGNDYKEVKREHLESQCPLNRAAMSEALQLSLLPAHRAVVCIRPRICCHVGSVVSS